MNKIIKIDEHHESLKILFENNIKNSIYFHFDFHIDIAAINNHSFNFVKRGLGENKSISEISEKIWYENRHKIGMHCGNFLSYAINYGMIKHLIWIMPDEIRPFNQVFYKVLQELGGVTFDELMQFTINDKCLSGKLYNINFTITTISRLDKLHFDYLNDNNQVILDIDLDILFDIYTKFPYIKIYDLYISTQKLYENSTLTIICDSINSGHTPSAYNFAGNYLEALYLNKNVDFFQEQEKKIYRKIKNLDNILPLENDYIQKALLLLNSMIKISNSEREEIIEHLENYYLKALLAKSNMELSLKYFQKAAIKYHDRRFYEYYAELLIRMEKYSQAESLINSCNISKSWRLFNYLGICQYKNKEYLKASINFCKSIDLNPINYIILRNAALCYKRLENRRQYDYICDNIKLLKEHIGENT